MESPQHHPGSCPGLSTGSSRNCSQGHIAGILAKVILLSYQYLRPLAADVIPCRSRVSVPSLFLPFPFLLEEPDAGVAS